MEEKDFDPKIIALAEEYAYVIEGVLGYHWNIPLDKLNVEVLKNTNDIEWIKTQLIFFLTKCKEVESNKEDRDKEETCLI